MVELNQNSNPRPERHSGSSSSAIDLTGTPTGLNTTPSSPSAVAALDPSDFNTRSPNRARRRASWGRVDAGQDPLRLDLPSMDTNSSNTNSNRRVPPVLILDDPFFSPTEETHAREYPPNARYGARGDGQYATAQAGPSSASLISGRDSDMSGSRDDDEVGLTSNVSGMGRRSPSGEWDQNQDMDTERTGGLTPGSRRRKTTLRYSATPSPLKKTGSAFKNVSRTLRRASLRVVNLAGSGLDDSIRLPDDDEHVKDGDGERWKDEELPDLRSDLPIRGRTLGCFGPQSRVRLGLYHFLVHP